MWLLFHLGDGDRYAGRDMALEYIESQGTTHCHLLEALLLLKLMRAISTIGSITEADRRYCHQT